MPTKPSDLPTWATDGSAEVDEPSGSKKSQGFVNREKPVHTVFNWFFAKVSAWLAWINHYNANHVHDGGFAGDLSAPKVSPVSHIDWGGTGHLEGTDLDGDAHIIVHQGQSTHTFVSDVLVTNDHLKTNKIQRAGFASVTEITDNAGVVANGNVSTGTVTASQRYWGPNVPRALGKVRGHATTPTFVANLGFDSTTMTRLGTGIYRFKVDGDTLTNINKAVVLATPNTSSAGGSDPFTAQALCSLDAGDGNKLMITLYLREGTVATDSGDVSVTLYFLP